MENQYIFLVGKSEDVDTNINNIVKEINSLYSKIAELNKQLSNMNDQIIRLQMKR